MRLAAYLIDSILVGFISIIFIFPMWIVTLFTPDNFLMKPVLFNFSLWSIFLYCIVVLYFVLMTYFTGSTLGKKVMHLKVISSSGYKLTLLNIIYRETIGRYLSGLLYLGYLLICVENEKQGFHDMLCDTRVIYTNTITITVPHEREDTASIDAHLTESSSIDAPLTESSSIKEDSIINQPEEHQL